MTRVMARDVRVRDLPPELDAAPDEVVRVTVDAGRSEELAELRALVATAARRKPGGAASPRRSWPSC